MDDKLKDMEKSFQLKMDYLQREFAILNQDKLQQNEEIKALREKLAIMEDTISNDLKYTSSNNENDNGNGIKYNNVCTISKINDDHDYDINATAKIIVAEGKSNPLQEERAALHQKELEQYEQDQQLKERLARRKTGIQDNVNNEPNHYWFRQRKRQRK
jgi:hypothetical protein